MFTPLLPHHEQVRHDIAKEMESADGVRKSLRSLHMLYGFMSLGHGHLVPDRKKPDERLLADDVRIIEEVERILDDGNALLAVHKGQNPYSEVFKVRLSELERVAPAIRDRAVAAKEHAEREAAARSCAAAEKRIKDSALVNAKRAEEQSLANATDEERSRELAAIMPRTAAGKKGAT